MVRTRCASRCSRRLKRPNMNTTGQSIVSKNGRVLHRDCPRFSRTNWKRPDPPFSGEHSDAVLRDFGFEFEEMRAAPVESLGLTRLIARIFGWSITTASSKSARSYIS